MLSRRRFIGVLAGAVVGGAGARLWGEDTPFPQACVKRSFRFSGPAAWSGKKILFVTDVHYGNFFGRPEAEYLNALVQRERPDLVAMGGDLAHTPETNLMDFLACWDPGCPTIFAPGNHDVTLGLGGSVMNQARRGGMTVLCNTVESWNGITFVGLPSALRARQNLDLLRRTGLKVVLGHEPDAWDWYAHPDVLQLAGHTHGGQIRMLGRPLELPTLGRKYPLGKYVADQNRSLLVSAGIGCIGLDVRINCPPDILKIDFV